MKRSLVLLAVTLAAALAMPLHAQTYPAKTLRLIMSYRGGQTGGAGAYHDDVILHRFALCHDLYPFEPGAKD